jgi:hypothetical protein
MIIDINEHQQIRLREVFEPVEFALPDGESLIIQMRDNSYEIAIENITMKSPDGTRYFSWYLIQDGQIMAQVNMPMGDKALCQQH